MGWWYQINRGAKPKGQTRGAPNYTKNVKERDRAIKKAIAKLKTAQCGTTIWVDRVWISPGSRIVDNVNRKGTGTVWQHDACSATPVEIPASFKPSRRTSKPVAGRSRRARRSR